MPKDTIDKAKRRAAGHGCLLLFSLNNSMCHMIASHLIRDCHGGLTEKERVLLQQLHIKQHERGEVYRRLGWRFLGLNAEAPTRKKRR